MVWIVLLSGLWIGAGHSDHGFTGNNFCIMFYNLENLFYPEDDSLTMDDEFTPEGDRHWTWYRYHQKITAVAKVIIAAGEGSPPEAIGLCEIENETVLSDLVNHPLLLRYHYKYIHKDSPDPRGIDVALLYRAGFSPADHTFHEVIFTGSVQKTRDILHVCGVFNNRDTADLLINHWTSRYGDVVTSTARRRDQSELLGYLTDSLQIVRKDPLIIAMGDFNDNENSESIKRLSDHNGKFLSLPYTMTDGIRGSYKFQGRWDTIDLFLVITGRSRELFSRSVFSLPQLVEADERYTGLKPKRTYIGYTYHGGVSDHLPVMLKIRMEGVPDP